MIKITIKSMDPKTNFKRGSYFVLICGIFKPGGIRSSRHAFCWTDIGDRSRALRLGSNKPSGYPMIFFSERGNSLPTLCCRVSSKLCRIFCYLLPQKRPRTAGCRFVLTPAIVSHLPLLPPCGNRECCSSSRIVDRQNPPSRFQCESPSWPVAESTAL